MPPQREPPAPTPLAYAPPDPPKRVAWLDLVGHAIFGVGLALVLVGFVGKEYNWSSTFGDFLQMYYPHMIMVGGFMCGLIISVRLGPFPR